MKEQWPDLIDINAGPIATGEATIADIGTQLFMEIIDVASGRKQSFAENISCTTICASLTRRLSPDYTIL